MGGAGGALGANTVAKAEPDGYRFLFAGPGQASLPAMHKHLPYDTANDFVGVSLVAQFPLVMVVSPKLPAKGLSEFIDLLRAKPGKYRRANRSSTCVRISVDANGAGCVLRILPSHHNTSRTVSHWMQRSLRGIAVHNRGRRNLGGPNDCRPIIATPHHHRYISAWIGATGPSEAFRQSAAHYKFQILFGQEIHFLGKHRNGLPVGTTRISEHGR